MGHDPLPIILLSAYSDLPERVLWLVDEYMMRSEPLEGVVQIIERVRHPVVKSEARKHPVSAAERMKRKQATA